MACTCPNEDCIQVTIDGVVQCNCPTTIENIVCPENCTLIMLDNGNAYCSCLETVEPIVTPQKIPINFDNKDFFTEASFTIAYSPINGRWISYYSFLPDYYVNHQNHFDIGFNYGTDKETLWSHTLGNSSFQVFQGRREPFIIEFPVINENVNKILESISLDIESKRWQSQWDYSVKSGVGFNKTIVYNSTNNSGILELNQQQNIRDTRNFPVTNPDNISQKILYSSLDNTHKFNYFFNRVINQQNNVPIWLWNETMTSKDINSKAISFTGKRVLERLRGSHFFTRLINDKDSQYQISLNKSINSQILYE